VRVTIIGSGLSAWAAFDALESIMLPNDSPIIIETNKRLDGDGNFASSSRLKSKFGSIFI
jgi:hypothetical protein